MGLGGWMRRQRFCTVGPLPTYRPSNAALSARRVDRSPHHVHSYLLQRALTYFRSAAYLS